MMCFEHALGGWCCRVHPCESFLLLVDYASLCVRTFVFSYHSSEVLMMLVSQITMFHSLCPVSHDVHLCFIWMVPWQFV